ncbi:DNA-binding transcriptional regulator OxyR [Frankia sp. CcI156]|uniref:Probable hydrogen peroxide-inducible genes activator n=1 Tax=Frankia casuarinae (strain DSM 45818 / CECT 9043 / HFP020203 / CcI3) TaxID=106370 RepID=Q2JBP7_FRACC|nr:MULTISPECIES: LysR substrate-binding domain-containing protein [Frankia]ABD11295.1 transcriptional regulator, LysR family [Frankia casuarinae]ETA00616.1 transcriptional regulator [Frankia sp. CcI6]EYT89725.1 transcriptional regulator [Frankia casuarinae]KDA41572.1 transcriptional regulator [Frankia sp. BMG5.23]KEZ35064.1 transcriptional regulator, LysR family [Frankia sp. CeD]
MASPHPTLAQLRALVGVADHRHFGRAAAALHVSQPTLSSAVAALERTLGVQLVERTTRSVLLTGLGEEIVRRARGVLGAVDDIGELAIRAREPLVGDIRLGVIPTVAPYLLPQLLPTLRERWPQARLRLRESQTATLLAELRGGALDLALLALPTDEPGTAEIPLYDEDFVLVTPAEHPLAGGVAVPVAAIGGQDLLLLEDGHCFRAQALEVCREAGARERSTLRAASLSTIVQMVAGGLGLTLVPAAAVGVEVGEGRGLAVATFRRPAPHRRVGLAYRLTSARVTDWNLLAAEVRAALPGTGLALAPVPAAAV